MLLDGGLVVLDEGLLHEADLLVVLGEAAHDDLLDDGVGLFGVLGVLLGLGEADALFVLDELLGDLALVEELGVQRGDLHGEVLAELDDGGVLFEAGADLEVHEDGDAAAHVDVGDAGALVVAGEAADLDVLADDEDLVVLLLEHGLFRAGILAGEESVQVCGGVLGDDLGDLVDVIDEEVVLGDEVALGVDLDDGADSALRADPGVGHTLGGDAAGLLLGGGEALLAQPLDGLFDIAVGLGEGLFAVHHTDAGHFAQVLNVRGSESHILSSFRKI